MLDTTLQATDDQIRALDDHFDREASKKAVMQSEQAKLRKSRVTAEQKRVDATKAGKAKRAKSGLAVTVTTENGKNRIVKKRRTTTDKMLKTGILQKYLKSSLDCFAVMVGDAIGVATTDGHDATNRLTAAYEAFSAGGGYSSKTLSDRQLDGLTAYRQMESRIPVELHAIFRQIVFEEVGASLAVPMTLTEMGEKAGYTWRQASAAGGMQITCVLMLVHHFLKEKGIR
jgi:hypothetical protein